MLTIRISPSQLRSAYVAIGILNTVVLVAWALVCAGRLNPGLMPLQELDPAQQLSLQAEHGAAAVWYSGALYLLVGIAATVNYWSDLASRRGFGTKRSLLRFGWVLLGIGALVISLDESSQLHEGLGLWVGGFQGMSVKGLTDASPLFSWVALLGPVLLGTAALLLGFFAYWLAIAPRARTLGLLGITCWAAVPILELVESRLVAAFGQWGGSLENFVEESLEVVGATLLLVAALEYLIARTTTSPWSPQTASVTSGRGAIFAGVALPPLVLVSLAGLSLAVDESSRAMVAETGYHFAGARIARVMETMDRRGNVLILGEGCSPETLERTFVHEVRDGGTLVAHPPPNSRGISPENVLTTLKLTLDEPSPRLTASLDRVAMLSTQLWHVQCGEPSDADVAVSAWMSQHFPDVERLSLPGVPSVVLTRVDPVIPLPRPDADHCPEGLHSESAPKGTVFRADEGGEVELVESRWLADQFGDETVIRVTLLWLARHVPERDYHVFVHLIDPAGKLMAQSDGIPVYDRYPFSTWVPGEIVQDSYDVLLPPEMPLEQVEIRVGLYAHDTGERLSTGQSDYVRVGRGQND